MSDHTPPEVDAPDSGSTEADATAPDDTPLDSPTLALAAAVGEIEAHAADAGWDQPARLFALVRTHELISAEPSMAEQLGIDADAGVPTGALTPIEQDAVDPTREFEALLAEIMWPDQVAGCAAVVERLVLPPDADDQIPEDAHEAAEFAASHEAAQEVRIVAGATREGQTWCAMRLRSHDDDQSVLGSPDLVPGLVDLVAHTLEEDPPDPAVHPDPVVELAERHIEPVEMTGEETDPDDDSETSEPS